MATMPQCLSDDQTSLYLGGRGIGGGVLMGDVVPVRTRSQPGIGRIPGSRPDEAASRLRSGGLPHRATLIRRVSNGWRRFAIQRFARREWRLDPHVSYVSFTFDDF